MVHRLLDIDDAIVSGTNPARGGDALDYERCARLHNYLVAHAWMAQHGKGPQDLEDLVSSGRSYFDLHGEEADAIRSRLDPALVLFLGTIIIPDSCFFFWVDQLADPSFMLGVREFFFQEDDELPGGNGLARFALLYNTVSDMGGHTLGVVYDQATSRVALPFVLEYVEFVSPVEEHGDMWFPLEVMLSNWIHLIRIGKVVAEPSDDTWPGPKMGVWTWRSYGAAQVDGAVAAMDRLTDAIEGRMPSSSQRPVNDERRMLLAEDDLEAAAVPKDSFICSFLTRVKRPRFSAIAPGLEVPLDAAAFIARQHFTSLPRYDDDNDDGPLIPPVLIFAAKCEQTINLDINDGNPRLSPFPGEMARKDGPTPAGLYSESMRRLVIDTAEEGFRLLLPFRLREDGRDDAGARLSDGSLVGQGTIAELFQHGFKPFGGEFRPQRLERLLDHWRGLIERGVWTVGEDGVKGSIEVFKDADGDQWQDYQIPCGW